MEGVLRQGVAELAGDLAAKNRAEGAVGVAHLQLHPHGLGLGHVKALFELFHQHLHVGGLFQAEVVDVLRLEMDVGVLDQRVGEQGAQIQLAGAAAGGFRLDTQQVGAAHQLLDGAHAQFCHIFPQLLGHKAHKVHHVLRLALEPLAQLRVLGADAHGAGVQVADAHHHAAHGHQRPGAEAELLGAQHGGDLGVGAAGVGGAGLPVRLGVQGADHRVQLSHHHDPGAGRPALQIAPDAGDGQMVPERDPELRKGAAHQLRRPPLLEAQLRVGEDLLADPDDGVLMFIDGLETLRFQRLFRHMKTSLRSILPIAAETHGCISIFYIKCENLQGFVDRRGNMGYDKPVQKVVSLGRRPCAAWS